MVRLKLKDPARYEAIEKLTGRSNYESWLGEIATYCDLHGLSGFFDGTVKRPGYVNGLKHLPRDKEKEFWKGFRRYLRQEKEMVYLLTYTISPQAYRQSPYLMECIKDLGESILTPRQTLGEIEDMLRECGYDDKDDDRFKNVVKLEGYSNYEIWLDGVETYCHRHGLSSFITGTAHHPRMEFGELPASEQYARDVEEYEENRCHVVDLICCTLVPDVAKELTLLLDGLRRGHTTPRDTLDRFEDRFDMPEAESPTALLTRELLAAADGVDVEMSLESDDDFP